MDHFDNKHSKDPDSWFVETMFHMPVWCIKSNSLSKVALRLQAILFPANFVDKQVLLFVDSWKFRTVFG
jgi:hypothetical protein